MNVIRLDEVDSTQTYARSLVGKVEHGTVVVADRQTAGRGRLGRTWLGPDEGLYLSMVLYPMCGAKDAPHLTLGAAVGMLRACDALAVARAHVKWPNDVVIAHEGSGPHGRLGPFRKVAGVIVEVAKMSSDRLEACVLGVGVNVRASSWPEEVALTAGALADAGFGGSRDDVLDAVTAAMPDALGQCIASFDSTLAALRARSATLGRRVEVDDKTGVARAIDDDGALVIEDERGASHTVRAGDVWFR